MILLRSLDKDLIHEASICLLLENVRLEEYCMTSCVINKLTYVSAMVFL